MKYLFLTLSVILIFVACNKKPTPTTTRYDTFKSGKWKMSSGTITLKTPGGKDTTLNYFDYIPTCHLDDYIAFNSNTTGAVFNGSDKCSAADGDSTQFTWDLTNNYNNISFYRGFSLIWSVQQFVNDPFRFDTLVQSPLKLDTIHGINDTLPGFTRTIPVLDTLWTLSFYKDSVPSFNIYNAQISDFSESAFTINFSMISTRPDTVGYHTGYYTFADPITAGQTDTIDLPILTVPDTFIYKITFSHM